MLLLKVFCFVGVWYAACGTRRKKHDSKDYSVVNKMIMRKLIYPIFVVAVLLRLACKDITTAELLCPTFNSIIFTKITLT